MNKTVTSNISGIIFHIEEEAFEKLSRYLSTIKSYFKDSEGRDEIMTDIEARIAEMLQEKVNKTKQVVLMADVDHVIAIMGKPEEFVDADQSQTSYSAPAADTSETRFTGRRRVFRDPDNRLIGGVCSGIANYFDFDPVWLRIAWVISLFLGFGFFVYIILWIIIPEAKTPAEKLEMRGEPVNINSIHKTFNEEFETVKKKVSNSWENVSSPENKMRARRSANKATDFLVFVFGSAIKISIKILVWVIIIAGSIALIALIASALGFNNVVHIENNGIKQSYSLAEVKDIFFTEPSQHIWVMIGLCLIVGVPLVMLIYAALKRALGIKAHYPAIRWVALGVWLIGVFICIYTGVKIGTDFRETANHPTPVKILQPKDSILYLSLDESFINPMYKESYRSHYDDDIFRLEKDRIFLGSAKIDLIKSETDSFEVIVMSTAQGINEKLAYNRAKNIQYSINQKDSLITMSPVYSFDRRDKWRAQNVRVVVKIPVNKKVYLSKNMLPMVEGADIANVKDVWDNHMVGRRWIMTAEGLDCVDCDGLKIDKRGKYQFEHDYDPREMYHGPVDIHTENKIKINIDPQISQSHL